MNCGEHTVEGVNRPFAKPRPLKLSHANPRTEPTVFGLDPFVEPRRCDPSVQSSLSIWKRQNRHFSLRGSVSLLQLVQLQAPSPAFSPGSDDIPSNFALTPNKNALSCWRQGDAACTIIRKLICTPNCKRRIKKKKKKR